jgi:aminoglycoside phosphotransferase (APT) family kinase protein
VGDYLRERSRATAGRGRVLNAIQTFLERRRKELGLERYGLGEAMTCVLVTPRFRASRHVVVLVFPPGDTTPALVVKVPRLAGDDEGVRREAAALTALHADGTLETVPRVVAFDGGMLVETALAGRPLVRADVRRSREACVAALEAWLTELERARPGGEVSPSDYERLLEEPLRRFSLALPDEGVVSRTLELTAPLRADAVPLVFEHGDLSEPNLIRLRDGRIGVLDWELAEPRGLPAHDLVFFLAYAAFAAAGATTAERQAAAYRDAVLRPGGWARLRLLAYAEGRGIDPELVGPLALACWARQTAALLERTGGGRSSPELVEWLRRNRYYVLWRESLRWAESAP